MKKFLYVISIIILMLGGLYFVQSYIMSIPFEKNVYSSVKILEFNSPLPFYDFYAPASYFNNNIKKKTLRDINHVKIRYHDKGKDYWIIFEDNQIGEGPKYKDIEIIYDVSSSYTDEEKQSFLSRSQLIDEENMIYHEGEKFLISYSHFNEDKRLVSIRIADSDNYSYNKEELNKIALSIMRDSIKLNERKEK